MKFEIEKRSELGRKGWIEVDGKRIEVPGILWYASSRIPPPSFANVTLRGDIKAGGSFFYPSDGDLPPLLNYPYFFPDPFHELVGTWNEKNAGEFYIADARAKISKGEKIYIMQNAIELYANPRNFVDAIIAIRNKIGYKPLYAPGIALPYNLPILIYAGVDIVDSIAIILKTRKRIYFTGEAEYRLDEIHELPCSCKYCRKGLKDFESLLMHNYEVMKNELIRIREAIEYGNLRSIVEARAAMHPHIASILRLLDAHHEYGEKRWPVSGNKMAVSCYSMDSPPIRRFRERISKRYTKPKLTKILLLLPCSSKKPYLQSKSHSFFRKVLNKISNRNIVHEVILTSPLGIVPRELENFYPAAHYDISTIGKWSRDEKEMLQDMLDEFLKKNKYDVIINHLPADMNFLDVDAISTSDGRPTSDESLKKLEKTLAELTEEYEYIYPSWRRRDDAEAMLSFQFGDAANGFLDGCNIKGKFPDYKIYCGDKQVAVYVAKRGMFSLTLPGAKRIGEDYRVEIDDFVPKGSVFAAGVKNAGSAIRAGDEVAVYFGDELRGVGVAKMNGEEMIESRRGEAVKIRHHI